MSLASDHPQDDLESFEEGSSSGGTDGYMTPHEYAVDEHEASSDEDTREALREADELKAEGTESFRGGMWAQALQSYRRGLARLPQRKISPPVNDRKGKGVDLEEGPGDSDDVGHKDQPEAEPLSELEQDCAKARSVLNGNIAACHVKLGEHKEAVEACSQALLDDPHYTKVLHRRATSNDLLGTWSSLASAEEDYKELLKVLPATSPLVPQIRQALQRVTPRREAAQKAEMGEMMDKLKGLGNGVLGQSLQPCCDARYYWPTGNFGLSTDNFKFEPNGQGGYSMSFVR
ncbi:hypothetical protein JB92DRAFT_3131775 [Gautieria morchelliformis]|nr:hypothetical protein JB92DRAFT_3131775 [Gautieria morchelliformis]